MNRKKELKAEYLQMKKDMGTFIICHEPGHKYYIEATNDLKGTMNGTLFKLNFGGHSNKELQKEWKAFGESAFKVEILEPLPHHEEGSSDDYKEELLLQAMIWREKYEELGYTSYKHSLINTYGRAK